MKYKNNAEYVIALADEIIHCVRDLPRVAPGEAGASDNKRAHIATEAREGNSTADLVDRSKRIYRQRRKRDNVFDVEGLFAEPGWDMLLDLFAAHLSKKYISITSACLAAHVPATTGLRWIHVLEEAGLVERTQDPADARRTFVRLTPDAVAKLTKVLADE